jgi:hypothetical protein
MDPHPIAASYCFFFHYLWFYRKSNSSNNSVNIGDSLGLYGGTWDKTSSSHSSSINEEENAHNRSCAVRRLKFCRLDDRRVCDLYKTPAPIGTTSVYSSTHDEPFVTDIACGGLANFENSVILSDVIVSGTRFGISPKAQ